MTGDTPSSPRHNNGTATKAKARKEGNSNSIGLPILDQSLQLLLLLIVGGFLTFWNIQMSSYVTKTTNQMRFDSDVPTVRKQKRIAKEEASTLTTDADAKHTSTETMPRTLVIYFPQYHKDSLNDRNWGDNFTDWDSLRGTPAKNRLGWPIPRPLLPKPDNVTHTLPATNVTRRAETENFPRLGYYDLVQTHPRKVQGQLAKRYGIDGFIYHHYWFYDPKDPGTPTLAKPLEQMLMDGHPDLPFLFNWCTTDWVDVWMGKALFQKNETARPPSPPGKKRRKKPPVVLQGQNFDPTPEMIQQHYSWLKPFFKHPNYIRVNKQPVLMLYSYDSRALPILESLRSLAIGDGFQGLHFVVGRSSHPESLYNPYTSINLTLHENRRLEFQLRKQRQTRSHVDPTQASTEVTSIYAMTNNNSSAPTRESTWEYNPFNQSLTYPYPLQYVVKPFEVPSWCTDPPDAPPPGPNKTTDDANNFPGPFAASSYHPEMIGVITSFDNTPRRDYASSKIHVGAGDPQKGESPDQALERFSKDYEAALYYQKCCEGGSRTIKDDDRFVVINAWNEWAEGMSIEPSDVYGYRWLKTIARVQTSVRGRICEKITKAIDSR